MKSTELPRFIASAATGFVKRLKLAAPGLPEAISFESRRHGDVSRHGRVALLSFSRRDVPVGSSSRRLLNQSTHSSVANSTASIVRHGPRRWDRLGLVEAIDGFREGIVVTVANTADRWLDACFRQALGILDREVLAASAGVMHEPATMRRSPVMESRLNRIENEARMRGS